MKQPIFIGGDAKLIGILTNIFSSFACCFNYETTTFDPDGVGEFPYITGVIITPSSVSFTLHATNPVTADYYKRQVTIQQPVYNDGIVKARVVFPNTTASYGSLRVTLSPCVVMFLHNNITRQDTELEIATAAPLSCTLDAVRKKLTIALNTRNTDFLTLVPNEGTGQGITSINGIIPTNGNINIVGVGDTTVTVETISTQESAH